MIHISRQAARRIEIAVWLYFATILIILFA